MKLSIITVNYNNICGLQRTIESLTHQSNKDWEWIIIDGGSNDGSKELIEKYQSYIKYWCSEPDRGIYHAMNKGIEHSTGEYLLFMNSGDWLYSSNTLSDIFSILEGDIWIGRSAYFDGKEYHGYSRAITNENFALSTLVRESLPHQSCFIKASLLKQRGGYDESFRLLADWNFFMKEALMGTTEFIFSDICTSVYDTTGMSATQTQIFQDEKQRILSLVPPFYRKDCSYVLSLQDVLRVPIGAFLYKLLYHLCCYIKRKTKE